MIQFCRYPQIATLRIYIYLSIIFISIAPPLAYSDQSSQHISYENDFLNFRCVDRDGKKIGLKLPYKCSNEDEWYTSGFFYEGRYQTTENDSNHHVGFGLGQMIFTPADLENHEIIKNDRPYAGWLYGSYFRETVSKENYERRELEVGVLGKYSKAEEFQNLFHRKFYGNSKNNAQGWKHQIGSEPGLVAVYHFSDLMFRSNGHKMDLNWLFNGRGGNIFIDAGLGTIVRVSLFNPLFPLFSPYSTPHTVIFFSLKTDVKIVGYDATFQGGGLDRVFNRGRGSPHHYEYQDIVPIVTTLEGALALKSHYGVSLGYSVFLRSKEFVAQSENSRWGRITLTGSF
ncbi:MAG: lipid A deacylase LpxR family protein [SAR324 cluster bacterium]|nr:lipid A deacylase LpxR family protein [SAR324 cluster bacterium]